MRFWPLLPAVARSMKRRAGHRTRELLRGADGGSIGQAHLFIALSRARGILPFARAIFLVLAGSLLLASLASAQNGSPGPRPNDESSYMRMLTDKGLHDIENESWNVYGQVTYISSWKPAFHAAYTNLNGSINSLLPTAERSSTGTATLYFGLRLWHGAEGYAVPELISEHPLSDLRGLGGAIQNFELQKGGTDTPQIYHSRS
jgi:high affinity Mn2+ porin